MPDPSDKAGKCAEITSAKQDDDDKKVYDSDGDQVADNLDTTELQPESEPSGFLHQTIGALRLEDFLPKFEDAVKPLEHSRAWNAANNMPPLQLPARDRQMLPSSLANCSSCRASVQTVSDEPRAPPQATPWSTKYVGPPASSMIEAHTLPSTSSTESMASRCFPRSSCGSCQKLQQQLMACSAKSARILTERHEAMKASRHLHERHATLEEELVSLHQTQVELADKFQTSEMELEDLCRLRAPTETKWREEASAWQCAYDAAKMSGGPVQKKHEVLEQAAALMETQVRELRRSLDEAQWDLEDARAACSSTQTRALSDAGGLQEEVMQARTVLVAEQAAAEAARAEATTAEVRLAASRSRCTGSSGSTGSYASSFAMHQAKADAEEHRCMELQAEVSDWHQRVSTGRAAFGRLREIHDQARSRLEARGAKPSVIDRGCSPLAREGQSAAEMELRTRLQSWETQLRELESQNQQLKRLQQLDKERHASKTERLRLKAERYRAGHMDLQRLYLEQRENRR